MRSIRFKKILELVFEKLVYFCQLLLNFLCKLQRENTVIYSVFFAVIYKGKVNSNCRNTLISQKRARGFQRCYLISSNFTSNTPKT